MLLTTGEHMFACNALKTAISQLHSKSHYLDIAETQKFIANEFWMRLMLDAPHTDSASTAEGRLARIDFTLYQYLGTSLDHRLMMLAWYYELVIRGNKFKDYRHAT